jgi:hypothetical protein
MTTDTLSIALGQVNLEVENMHNRGACWYAIVKFVPPHHIYPILREIWTIEEVDNEGAKVRESVESSVAEN